MLFYSLPEWLRITLSVVTAAAISLLFTPVVKRFAVSIGAIDMPGQRHIHSVPTPRMGGIAIVVAFMVSVLMFAKVSKPVSGILLGSLIIAVMGGLDDKYNLNPWIKLAVQIVAAFIAISFGVVLDGITNPFAASAGGTTMFIGDNLAIILTLGWIIICTNAVNLIDGLDGLACGITAISALTMMIVSLMVSDINVTVILACLLGACAGFLPYNLNPAKIFMGDVGAQTLGFILATSSTLGLFKLHAAITFLVPLLALAVPLGDTVFAIIRRLLKGQSPFKADKGHFHHRLLALGMTQKQVVAVLYAITGIMGLISILMTGSSPVLKIVCVAVVFIIAIAIWVFVLRKIPEQQTASKYSESEPDMKIYDKEDNPQ